MDGEVMVSSEDSSSLWNDEILPGGNKSGVNFGTEGLYSTTQTVIMTLICLFICIFGSIGNSMVIIAILLSKKLQTPTNAFVVCLATADLITCSLQMWIISCVLGWLLPYAKWLCVAIHYMIGICISASILNLAAISINRYILITKPLKTYQKIYTPVNTGVMVAATWIISAMISCTPQLGVLAVTLAETLVVSGNLAIIVTCYTLVFRYVKTHSNKIRNHQTRNIPSISHTTRNATTQSEAGQISDQRQQTGFKKVDLDVTKNLLIMIVAFFLCFMPYNITKLVPRRTSMNWYAVILLLYISSCINPVIYARRHPHFKIVIKEVIKCQYQNIPEPSGILRRFISRRINPNP